MRMIGRMVHHSGWVTLVALVLIAGSIWGLTRTPTAFIPTEDQGYMMVAVQLPDAGALGRTEATRWENIARADPESARRGPYHRDRRHFAHRQ